MVIITGDMNAKVGACNKDKERIMGPHGTGTINENGERLVDFCGMNKYVITGTLFPQKDIYKNTWHHPVKGQQIKLITYWLIKDTDDQLQIPEQWEAHVDSDHQLVRSSIKLKLLRQKHKSNTRTKSSVECKKVVSAFSSFCRKGNFVLRFPLYFLVFWHLISSIKEWIIWVETCFMAQNMSFYM